MIFENNANIWLLQRLLCGLLQGKHSPNALFLITHFTHHKKTQLVGLKTPKPCHNVLFQSIKMPNLFFKYNFVLKNKKTQDSVSILRRLKGRKCPPARHSAQNNGVGPWSLIISLLSAACWSTFAASLHLSVWWLQSGGGKRGHLPLWSSFIMSTSAFIALLGTF